MSKLRKLSTSKPSLGSLSVKSKPLPPNTAKKISAASDKANEQIARNNQVYASSNRHASFYATK